MAYFAVTPTELRSTAGTLREYNSNFKNQVSALESSEGTLNSSWEGPAKDAFHNSFLQDKNYMDNFAALIENYCVTLENMAAKYEQGEATNVEIANNRKH